METRVIFLLNWSHRSDTGSGIVGTVFENRIAVNRRLAHHQTGLEVGRCCLLAVHVPRSVVLRRSPVSNGLFVAYPNMGVKVVASL